MFDLRTLTTFVGDQCRAGLHRMEGLIAALECCALLALIDGVNVRKLRETMRDMRQRARLQISARGATLIIDKKRWRDIQSFKDAVSWKTWVKLPHLLKQKLEAMSKSKSGAAPTLAGGLQG